MSEHPNPVDEDACGYHQMLELNIGERASKRGRKGKPMHIMQPLCLTFGTTKALENSSPEGEECMSPQLPPMGTRQPLAGMNEAGLDEKNTDLGKTCT